MKKTALLVASVCLLSGMVAWSAGPDPVTSVNAVGVTKLDLPAGFSLMSIPFSKVGGGALTLEETFGINLPDGTSIYFYLPGVGYDIYTLLEGDGWYDNYGNLSNTNKVLRGEGFWVAMPTNVTLSIAGEVPGSADGIVSIPLASGFSLVSFAFPQNISIADSGIVPADGDTLYRYANGAYEIFTYLDPDGWFDNFGNPVSPELTIGKGYWYGTTTTTNWSQAKTYLWP